MTEEGHDPILDRLRDADPAREGDGDEAVVRAEVKRRAEQAQRSLNPLRRPRRLGLLVVGA